MKHSASMLVPSALVALLLSSLATAAVPLRVPIQGMVRDNAGVPVHSGAFSTTFRLYDAPDAAQPLWMEEHTSVGGDCAADTFGCLVVTDGVFRVQLGAVTPLGPDLLAGGGIWMGMQVEGEPELPRRRLGSAPYAVVAAHAAIAQVATDLDCTGCLFIEQLAPEAQDTLTQDALAAVAQVGYITAAQAAEADKVLSEAQVDDMVANNGYAFADALAQLATTGSYQDLADVPPALASLTLTEDGFLAFGGTVIVNADGEWVGSPTGLQGPKGDPGDDGALAGLQCAEGEVVKQTASGWTCAVDAVLSETQVEQHVTNGELELHPTTTIGGAQPALLNGDKSLTVAGNIETTVGGVTFPDGTTQTTAAASNAGSGGTVIYTRCTWKGTLANSLGSCIPPECPSGWDDLGNTGRVKTAIAMGSSETDGTNWSESAGYEERACYATDSFAVTVTRCTWKGTLANSLGSCIPPECPSGWTDLGNTGRVKAAIAMGSSETDGTNWSESAGYEERTCVK